MSSTNGNYFVVFVFSGGCKRWLGQIGLNPFPIDLDQIVNVAEFIGTMAAQHDLHRDSFGNATCRVRNGETIAIPKTTFSPKIVIQ